MASVEVAITKLAMSAMNDEVLGKVIRRAIATLPPDEKLRHLMITITQDALEGYAVERDEFGKVKMLDRQLTLDEALQEVEDEGPSLAA